ncbi:MAG: BLUF domain-containing protein [Pseudomonadota bacterium]
MGDNSQITHLLYRSRATNAMSGDELRDLLKKARERNASENLTGLLVHDRGRFVQWLEGPPENLQRIWTSIKSDPRHSDVERIFVPRLQQRMFSDWDMQLGHDGEGGVPQQGTEENFEQVTLPDKSIQDLRDLNIDAHEIIRGVSFWHAIPNIKDLTMLLARGSDKEVQNLFDQIIELQPSVYSLSWHLLGPVARELGDAWHEDRLFSVEITVAQSRLCQLLHSVSRKILDDEMPWREGMVLVSPMPGENALVGAAFACIAFEAMGWIVQWTFAQERDELLEMVKRTKYKIVHLEISNTFTHEESLPELSNFIQQIRMVSANPTVKVLVGGRAFSEKAGLSVLIGADGDALSRGSEEKDIEAMLQHEGWDKPMDPMMIAQVTLLEACQKICKNHFERIQHQDSPSV